MAPEVGRHCAGLGLDPLAPAVGWMAAAFVGHLAVDQTLLLWDRVVGFDSLAPLAVMAAGVFHFLRPLLLQAGSAEEAREVLADLTLVQVAPVLQVTLFSAALPGEPGGREVLYAT